MVEAIVLDSEGLNSGLHIGNVLDPYNCQSCAMALTYPLPKGVFDDLSMRAVAQRKAPNSHLGPSREGPPELMRLLNTPSRNDENCPCVEAA